MSEAQYLRKISEQAAELKTLNNSLMEREAHSREMELELAKERNISGAARQPSDIGELAYRRMIERNLEKTRQEVETRDKALAHFQRMNDELIEENKRLKDQLAATQKIRGITKSSRLYDSKIEKRSIPDLQTVPTKAARGVSASKQREIPAAHPQAPPTIAKYNELRKTLKEVKSKLVASDEALSGVEAERDNAFAQIQHLQNALTLNVPESQVHSQMELLQNLTFMRKELTSMRAAMDGVPLEEMDHNARAEQVRRIKFMRETDYDNMPEVDPMARLTRLTNEHRCLLDFVHKDLEKATTLATELDVSRAEVASLKEIQAVSDAELATAKKILDGAQEEVQALEMQIDESRVREKTLSLDLARAEDEKKRLLTCVDEQAEEGEMLRDRVRRLEQELANASIERAELESAGISAQARIQQLEKDVDLALEAGGVRCHPRGGQGQWSGGGSGVMANLTGSPKTKAGGEDDDDMGETPLERRLRKAKEAERDMHAGGEDAGEYEERREGDLRHRGASSRSDAQFDEWLQKHHRGDATRDGGAGTDGGATTLEEGHVGISADELEELRTVDAAVGALSGDLLAFLRARDAAAANREHDTDATFGWLDLESLRMLSSPLAHLLQELRVELLTRGRAADEAKQEARHALERQTAIEAAANQAGKEGAAALEEAQAELTRLEEQCDALRDELVDHRSAADELVAVADLLVSVSDGLDMVDFDSSVELLRRARREIAQPHVRAPILANPSPRGGKPFAFGSSVGHGDRLEPVSPGHRATRAGRGASPVRSPHGRSSTHSKFERSPRQVRSRSQSRSRSRSPLSRSQLGGRLDVTDLRGAAAAPRTGASRPMVLGEAMRIVLRRVAHDATQAQSSKAECKTLRRRLTECEMRIEAHHREVSALKTAYDSTQDLSFLRADSAKGESEELRRALDETLRMLEKQNMITVTLEARYEAATRDATEKANDATIVRQREATCHYALHGTLARCVDVAERLANTSGNGLSASARAGVRALYLPSSSAAPYDVVRFAEKLLVALMACLGTVLDAQLPSVPSGVPASIPLSIPGRPPTAVAASDEAAERAYGTMSASGPILTTRASARPPPVPTADGASSSSSVVSSLDMATLPPPIRGAAAVATPLPVAQSTPSEEDVASVISKETASSVAVSLRREAVAGGRPVNKKLEAARKKFQAARTKDSQLSESMESARRSSKDPDDG